MWPFSNLQNEAASFGGAIDTGTVRNDPFESWFSDADRARWAVELLNVCLKKHERQRFLRLDKDRHRYFFAPKDDGPKKIYWKIGGTVSKREVTTRHYVTVMRPDCTKEKVQSGWRHQAVQARFVLLPFGLFLRVEPTWMLTKADGKTPCGGPRVGPILSHWLNQERNGQILRSLRFWSLVLARGKAEVLIPTEQRPIRIGLTPASSCLDFGIVADQMDFDAAMRAEMEDDVEVPQLGFAFGETSPVQEDANEAEN